MSESLLTLPRLGETMESGRVVAWLKRPGEAFRRGETLVEIETDKTVVELPALAEGRLLEILAESGSELAVGAPLARLGDAEDGERRDVEAALESEAVERPPAAEQPDPGGARGAVALPDGRLAWRRWQARGERGGSVLLLHGFCADSTTWLLLAPALAERGHDCLAFDLPSHGASALEAERLEELVAAVLAGLEALDERPALIVGHSLGALVAAELALRRPEGLERLLLLAPAGLGSAIDRDFLRALARADSAGALELLLRRLGGNLPPPPLEVCRQVVTQNLGHPGLAALADDLAGPSGQRHSLIARLEALQLPVRVLVGLDDRVTPWQQVTNLPPRVAVHLLRGAGHAPHWEQPELIADLAAEGLRREERP